MIELLILCGIVAFAGWVSIVALMQSISRAIYFYRARDVFSCTMQVFIAFLSPVLFFGIIAIGLVLIKTYWILTTGQL